jgi:cytoskeletal protein CcmA (bactofilin family)
MPPFSQYSSSIDGSLYITSAKNSAKHGNGAALIENGVSLFGSADQYFQSTNVASDLIVDSKKVLKVGPTDSTAVEVSKLGVNTKVKGSFNVDQVSILTGDVIASSKLNVAGVSTFTDAVNAQSTLNVTGAVSASNSLTVEQASTLKGAVVCESTLASTGAATFASTVNIAGASTLVGDVNMSNNCVIAGNLTVSGLTTSISTENVLVKDNILVLNSASAVGKDGGLMFKRNGVDSTAFWWDESALSFVLASTESLGTDETLNVKELQKLKCAGLEAATLAAPGFATTTVSLAGNSAVPVPIPGVTQQRGSFEFIIEADNVDGSVFNYKIVKNKAASDSPSLMGIHQEGDDLTQVWIKWDVLNKAPEIYHKVTNASATPITYKIKYLRVD